MQFCLHKKEIKNYRSAAACPLPGPRKRVSPPSLQQSLVLDSEAKSAVSGREGGGAETEPLR